MFLLIFDFKDRCMKLRVGRPDFKIDRADFGSVSSFMGGLVANSMVSFLVIILVFTLILTILFHPLFWQLVSENLGVILGLIFGTPLIVFILKLIAGKLLVDPVQGIRNRR
jgi:hypothetical protein